MMQCLLLLLIIKSADCNGLSHQSVSHFGNWTSLAHHHTLLNISVQFCVNIKCRGTYKTRAILLALPHLQLYNVPLNYYYDSHDDDEVGYDLWELVEVHPVLKRKPKKQTNIPTCREYLVHSTSF